GYSQTIRDEIKFVFNETISAETLRPLFSGLKMSPYEQSAASPSVPEKLALSCELAQNIDQEKQCEPLVVAGNIIDDLKKGNRKYALIFSKPGQSLFCNHAGVLLFSSLINQLATTIDRQSHLVIQWLTSILLGMVNIEQTKLIDPESIKAMMGTFLKSLKHQRVHLAKMATDEVIAQLFAFNCDLVQCHQYADYYYDPHTKHYTGMQKILKGWCSGSHGIAKILAMDFIHTSEGHPVYVKHLDNFYDLRERYVEVIDEFRKIMKSKKTDVMTVVIDRGIFGLDVFKDIIEKEYLNLITWEKGYKRNLWNAEKISGSFSMTRTRNHANDLLKYQFSYIDQIWTKNAKIRQIIVQATNPKAVMVEVSILATDLQRPAEEIVRLMFKRWIQENDFKYLIKHFGINEITSYSSVPYSKLIDLVKDKDMISGSYKAKELNHKDINQKLSKLLLQEHTKKKNNQERQEKILELTKRLETIKNEILQEKKKVSRLESLIADQYCRLDTKAKALLDVIKIIARNMFYQLLEPFKDSYNNYRDDHVVFRNITRSAGVLVNNDDSITVLLMPTISYETKVYKIVESFLDFVNQSNSVLPDGSNRKIIFKLNQKSNNLFAISNGQK
ncbi:MAG: putative transposase, partial [Methylococcaceae bacterium]